MQYSAITRPGLWPNDTLQEARIEVAARLKCTRLNPTARQEYAGLFAAIEHTLSERGARLRRLPARL